MLRSLRLDNFGIHKSLDIYFDDSRLHFLVGMNDGGKTTALTAIAFLDSVNRTKPGIDLIDVINCDRDWFSVVGTTPDGRGVKISGMAIREGIGRYDLRCAHDDSLSDRALFVKRDRIESSIKTGREILLIEHPEIGLHPLRQCELVEGMQTLIDRYPELQIIATTHSPYIIDRCKYSQVHAIAPSECIRLDNYPDAEWSAQTLTTGEFWTTTF